MPCALDLVYARQRRRNIPTKLYMRPIYPPHGTIIILGQVANRPIQSLHHSQPPAEIPIGWFFYPCENSRSDAFVQPSLRAGKRRANSCSFRIGRKFHLTLGIDDNQRPDFWE